MELRLEVLHIEGLLPELRSLLRPEVRPSVEVTFQAQQCRSPAIQARGSAAAFSWKAFFRAGLGDRRISFRVYDQRGAEPTSEDAIFADAVLGEAELPLLEVVPHGGLLSTFSLRRGKQTIGRLAIHYELAQLRGPPCQTSFLVSNAFGDTICANGTEALLSSQVLLGKGVNHGAKNKSHHAARMGLSVPELQLGALARGAAEGNADEQVFPHWPPGGSLDLNSARSTSSSSSSSSRRSAAFSSRPHSGSRGAGGEGSAPEDDGFESAMEDFDSPTEMRAPRRRSRTLTDAERRQACERVADSYVQARQANEFDRLLELLASDAVVSVPRPLGGFDKHDGREAVEEYLLQNPAATDTFRDWAHVSTEDDPGAEDAPAPSTVVRWTGKLYKLGFWHAVTCEFLIDPDCLIRRVSLARSR